MYVVYNVLEKIGVPEPLTLCRNVVQDSERGQWQVTFDKSVRIISCGASWSP